MLAWSRGQRRHRCPVGDRRPDIVVARDRAAELGPAAPEPTAFADVRARRSVGVVDGDLDAL